MILLMDAWTHDNYECEQAEWAVVSLSIDTIDNFLDRITQAQALCEISGASFYRIEYWDIGPVWIGCCEVWEELYPETVQIVEHLQAGEHGLPLHTECTRLIVTDEGVSWETTFKNSPGTAGTETVTTAMLEKMRLMLVLEEELDEPCHIDH